MTEPLFSADHLSILHALQAGPGLPLARMAAALNAACGTAFTEAQVRRHLREPGSQPEAAVGTAAARGAGRAPPPPRPTEADGWPAGLRPSGASSAQVMERYVALSECILVKSAVVALDTDEVRTLGGAATAAKSALAIYRLARGLEGPGAREPGAAPDPTALDFNFANIPVPRADGSGYVGGWPPRDDAPACLAPGAAAAPRDDPLADPGEGADEA